jgi:hypothetical protein
MNADAKNTQGFDPDGRSPIHDALSFVCGQNPQILQTFLISAGIVDAVCIDTTGSAVNGSASLAIF